MYLDLWRKCCDPYVRHISGDLFTLNLKGGNNRLPDSDNMCKYKECSGLPDTTLFAPVAWAAHILPHCRNPVKINKKIGAGYYLLFLLVSTVTPKQDAFSGNKGEVELQQPRFHRQRGKRAAHTQ